ncbi:hypothetical protein QYE76_034695 [Lolium multiflorum]|uniref:BTB domain-containing protein n=1 Tax=Lolium multiflorum TaxID=4521 RepID=A0AAD8QZL3_LOLMU|nr:hypothetical protein QYE76_034695 [Lolium multiflorum]
MEGGCTNLTDVTRSTQLLKINGYCMAKTMDSNDGPIKSRWNVHGYDWEVQLYPAGLSGRRVSSPSLALKLIFVGEARTGSVRASLCCRLVDPRGKLKPSEEKIEAGTFKRPQDCSSAVLVMQMEYLEKSGYLKDDSLTVECTLTVLKEIPDVVTRSNDEVDVPSPGLHHDLGELLQSETGADVTFVVSGESFAAHKVILASRSPVLMAEFFGKMKEKTCRRVEVKDMEAPAFEAMLHFIYTDTAPELDEPLEKMVVMAQHLLAAADRYGLDRLKLMCEDRLFRGITVDTAAMTLALAEHHSCSLLKDKCLEFIVSTPAILDAVMATEEYTQLEETCPFGPARASQVCACEES